MIAEVGPSTWVTGRAQRPGSDGCQTHGSDVLGFFGLRVMVTSPVKPHNVNK